MSPKWAGIAFGGLTLLSALPAPSIIRDGFAFLALAAVAVVSWNVSGALGLLLVFMPFRVVIGAMTPGLLVLVPDVAVLTVVAHLVGRHARSIWPLDVVEWLSFVFGTFGLLATVHAHAHLSGAILELRDLFLFVVLYAAVRRLARYGEGPAEDFWERIAPYALGAIAAAGLQGIAQTFVLGHAFLLPGRLAAQTHVSAVNAGRPYGWIDNPNAFGELGVLGLILLGARVRSRILSVAWWEVALCAVFAAMVVLSYSRTAYLVAILIGGIYLASRVATAERLAAGGLLAAMALCVVLVPGARARAIGSGPAPVTVTVTRHIAKVHRSEDYTVGHHVNVRRRARREFAVFSSQYFAKSAKAGRIHNLKLALRLAKEHPLGTGLGTFGSSGSKVFGTTIKGLPKNFYADNNYVVVLAETGILGTLLFAFLGLSVFRRILGAPVPASARSLTFALFLALAVMSVTGDAWEQFNLTVYPWLAFAVLIGAAEGSLRYPRPHEEG